MSLPTSSSNSGAQLPFYTSSSALTFYLDDPNSFSQVLTLYNPYEFVVRYKVLCTAPQKYSIAEPHGEIRAKHSVDTIVRLLDTSSSSSNQNVQHRIRVQFFDRRRNQDLTGKCDVTCNVQAFKPSEQHQDAIDSINCRSRMNGTGTNAINSLTNSEQRDPLLIFVLSLLGLLCGLVLVLPTVPDPENNHTNLKIPSYLHMTTNAKVIASYILGLLTVVFIRR